MQKNGYFHKIRQLTKHSRKADFGKRPHVAVVSALADADYSNLTFSCAAHTAAYIEDALFAISNREKAWLGAGTDRTLDEARYKSEVQILHRLCERLQYTDALQEWMTRNSLAFVDHLRRDERFAARLRKWPSLTVSQREALLKIFTQAQTVSFSKNSLPLSSPQVVVTLLQGQAGAACDTPPVSEVGNAAELCIKIDPYLLKQRSPRLPLSVAFHEGIHAISWQLALAVQQGNIKPGHLLYKDAKLRKSCLNHGAIFPLQISSVYRENAEEKLAYSQQKMFQERLFGKAALNKGEISLKPRCPSDS